jgi:hypothetical protein
MNAPGDAPLWTPDPFDDDCAMRSFFVEAASQHPTAPDSRRPYAAWHAWSVEHPEIFWEPVWKFSRVIAEAHQLFAGEGVLVGFDPLEGVLIVLLSQRAARATPALHTQRVGGRQHAAAIAS